MSNHPGDRHVLATAVWSGASVIVTSNLRHFPRRSLDAFNIEALSVDDFLQRLYHRDATNMLAIIVDQASDLQNPVRSTWDVLDALALHAPRFAEIVRLEFT